MKARSEGFPQTSTGFLHPSMVQRPVPNLWLQYIFPALYWLWAFLCPAGASRVNGIINFDSNKRDSRFEKRRKRWRSRQNPLFSIEIAFGKNSRKRMRSALSLPAPGPGTREEALSSRVST